MRKTSVRCPGRPVGDRAGGGDLVGDDTIVSGRGEGEHSGAQVEYRSCPVADHAGVGACAALPLNGHARIGTQDAHPPGTGPVARPAPARQRTFPCHADVAGGGSPHEIAEVFGQPPGGAGRVSGKVEKVVEVGDHHGRDGSGPAAGPRRPGRPVDLQHQLDDALDRLRRAGTDLRTVEVKAAAGGLPRSITQSVCHSPIPLAG